MSEQILDSYLEVLHLTVTFIADPIGRFLVILGQNSLVGRALSTDADTTLSAVMSTVSNAAELYLADLTICHLVEEYSFFVKIFGQGKILFVCEKDEKFEMYTT